MTLESLVLGGRELANKVNRIKSFGFGIVDPMDENAVYRLMGDHILLNLSEAYGVLSNAVKNIGLGSKRTVERKIRDLGLQDYVDRIRNGELRVNKKDLVRETLQRAFYDVIPDAKIDSDALEEVVEDVASKKMPGLREAVRELECHIAYLLSSEYGFDGAAERLGVDERTVKRWLQRNYNIAYGENGENKVYLSKRD